MAGARQHKEKAAGSLVGLGGWIRSVDDEVSQSASVKREQGLFRPSGTAFYFCALGLLRDGLPRAWASSVPRPCHAQLQSGDVSQGRQGFGYTQSENLFTQTT